VDGSKENGLVALLDVAAEFMVVPAVVVGVLDVDVDDPSLLVEDAVVGEVVEEAVLGVGVSVLEVVEVEVLAGTT